MSRTVCGTCWALYDDYGKCECEAMKNDPVAWIHTDPEKPRVKFLEWKENEQGYRGQWIKTPLYKQSIQRTLTDEVIADLWHQNGGFHHHFARAIERWLKGQA